MSHQVVAIIIAALVAVVTSQHNEYNEFGTNLGPRSPYTTNPGQYNRNYRPDIRHQDIQNLRDENINHGDGNYNYHYENTDGTVASQRGYPKIFRSEEGATVQGNAAEGFYQYYAPNGQLIRVDYIADENGFQPRGDHLPVAPPIPEAIQRSLDLIYSNIQKQNPYRKPNEYNYQEPYKNYNPQRYRPDGIPPPPKPYLNTY